MQCHPCCCCFLLLQIFGRHCLPQRLLLHLTLSPSMSLSLCTATSGD
jgi:hypothetical protein